MARRSHKPIGGVPEHAVGTAGKQVRQGAPYIPPKGSKTVHQHPYWAGPSSQDFVQKEVGGKLKHGVIEQSEAERPSLIVVVPKKDGKPRFCVDYRRLNAVTQGDSYHSGYSDGELDEPHW